MAEMRIMPPRSIILQGLNVLRCSMDHLPSIFLFDSGRNFDETSSFGTNYGQTDKLCQAGNEH
jgi:hypothetical protein